MCATNVFIDNYNDFNEQTLIEDVIIEAIQMYGIDCYYVPRDLNNFDTVYGADDISSFERAYTIEVYINDVGGFTGEGSLMSKFGLEIRDQIRFTIAARIFKDQITAHENDVLRPKEGDLIYFPLNKKFFEIKFTEDKPFFYMLGTLPTYEMYCELFEFSNESFNTGIEELDVITSKESTNIFDYGLVNQDGLVLVDQNGKPMMPGAYTINNVTADNDEIQRRSDQITLFTEQNPFAEDNF